jgi:hypothetical protein
MLYVSEGHATLCLADAKLLFANAYLPPCQLNSNSKERCKKRFLINKLNNFKNKRVFDFHHKDM